MQPIDLTNYFQMTPNFNSVYRNNSKFHALCVHFFRYSNAIHSNSNSVFEQWLPNFLDYLFRCWYLARSFRPAQTTILFERLCHFPTYTAAVLFMSLSSKCTLQSSSTTFRAYDCVFEEHTNAFLLKATPFSQL